MQIERIDHLVLTVGNLIEVSTYPAEIADRA